MKKTYYKLISKLSGLKPKVKDFDLSDFDVKFREQELEVPAPSFNKLNKTYVLIRRLPFQLEIKINKMQHFKSLLKWNELYMFNSVVFRDYHLKFSTEVKSLAGKDVALKLPAKVSKIDKKDINFIRKLKLNEEIIKILPYVRKVDKKRLLRIPVRKRPLYKLNFSKEQMKIFKQKTAEQNKTGWANIEIFEIYDKFFANHFSNIKQIQGSKELECNINIANADKVPEKSYYLLLGKKRDSNQPVKALIDPANIEPDDYN